MADPVTDAANQSLNSTLDGGTVDTLAAVQDFLPLVFERFWGMLAAPYHHPEMLWIILPLFFTFVVMEFYFGRHRDEELGWAAAVANSLILIIVAIDLLKHSFHFAPPWTVLKEIVLAALTDATLPLPPQVLLLILFLFAVGIAITLINYFHLLPRRIAFEVSGHPPVNFLAYFAIVIVYSTGSVHEVPFDMATLVAGSLLFILLLLAVFSLRKLVGRITGAGFKNY